MISPSIPLNLPYSTNIIEIHQFSLLTKDKQKVQSRPTFSPPQFLFSAVSIISSLFLFFLFPFRTRDEVSASFLCRNGDPWHSSFPREGKTLSNLSRRSRVYAPGGYSFRSGLMQSHGARQRDWVSRHPHHHCCRWIRDKLYSLKVRTPLEIVEGGGGGVGARACHSQAKREGASRRLFSEGIGSRIRCFLGSRCASSVVRWFILINCLGCVAD